MNSTKKKMNIRNKLKETLEWTLATTFTLVAIESSIIIGDIKNPYDSLSRGEKIEYLENKLNSSFYKYPPMVNPKTGGAISLWNRSKENAKKELERLRNYELEK